MPPQVSSPTAVVPQDEALTGLHSKWTFMLRSLGSLREIQAVFRKYDADGDGALNRAEFGAALKGLNVHFAGDNVDLLFEKMDENRSQYLELMEFVSGCLPVDARYVQVLNRPPPPPPRTARGLVDKRRPPSGGGGQRQ